MIQNIITTHKRVAIPLMTAWTMTVTFNNNDNIIASGGLDNIISIYRINKDVQGWESKVFLFIISFFYKQSQFVKCFFFR